MIAKSIVRSSYFAIPAVVCALTLAGCPPETANAGPPPICIGDWRLVVTENSGITYSLYRRLYMDGTATQLPIEFSENYHASWELVGDMFQLRDDFPEGNAFIAVIQDTCALRGVAYKNADPNQPFGSFSAEYLPSLDVPELPDPVTDR